MKKIRNSLPLLFVALCVLLATAAYAAETGFIVGRAYIELDGYEGHHLFLVNEVTILLVHAIKDKNGDWQEKIYKTRCDKKGYYYLSKMPLDGHYRVAKLIQDGGLEIVARIPSPIGSEGASGEIFKAFSGSRIANHIDVIDIGETVLVIDEGGAVSIKHHSATKTCSISKEWKYSWENGIFGLSILEYFSNNASGDLKKSTSKALEDKRKYLSAVSFYYQANELKESDKDAAVEKYRAAIQAYPAYDDAYLALALVLKIYILSGRIQDVEQVMKSVEKAVIYDRCAYIAREAKRFDLAVAWTKKALDLYPDGSISRSREDIERSLSTLTWKEDLESHWRAYLKSIQDENDYDNWKGKPYNLYIKRNPNLIQDRETFSFEGYSEKIKDQSTVKKKEEPQKVYTIQVAAFSVEKNAQNLAKEIRDKGYQTYVVKGKNLYKVQVEEFETLKEAQKISQELKKLGYPIWITQR